MKSWLKKALVVVLSCVCVISMVACGEKKVEEGGAKVDFDFSGYPKELNSWGIEDMQKYLEAREVFKETDWEMELTGGDLGPMHVSSGIMYMERTTMSIYDLVMFFDPSGDSAIQTQKEYAKANKALNIEGGQPVIIDRIVGNFAFKYEETTDQDHKTALIKAIDDIVTYYGEN